MVAARASQTAPEAEEIVESFGSLAAMLLQAAPDAVIISRADGTITMANRRAHEMFGYPPDGLLNEQINALVPDDIRPQHLGLRAEYLSSAHPPLRRMALRGCRRDGVIFAVEVSVSVLTSPDGQTFVIAVLRDDTAHREARQAHELLASIVQSSHDAIVTTDPDGVVLSWNPGAGKLYGYQADAMLGRPIDAIVPADRRTDEAELRKLVCVGGCVDRYRTVRVRADGKPVPVSVLVSPLRDSHDAIVGITTTARDINDRERTEAHVQAVLDAAPDALLGVDETGRVALVNAEAERMFGMPRHDLIDLPVHALLPEGLPATTTVLHTNADATVLDIEHVTAPSNAAARWASRTALRRDGDRIPVEIVCSTLHTDDGVVIVAAIRDITDRLAAQAEQQRLRDEADRQRAEARIQRTQRLESLGQLAGGIAHDFNNLLAVILNYATFIVEDAAGTPHAADGEQIARAARRGSDLTHQLLAFARREVIRPRPLDVNTVIAEVNHMLQRSIGEHITLTTSPTAQLPTVMADPGQLEQVLINLAVNARDAMPAGGHVTIDTAAVDLDTDYAAARPGLSPGHYVRIRVSDTGEGMSKDVIAKAFDPFFTTKPAGQGTGLGLATVYGIITQAGGTVQIYSEPGLGTTITLLLPAGDAAAETARPTLTAGGFDGHGRTILLVEDEPALREVVERILGRGGYTVLAAENGTEALRIAEEHHGHIDALLTDVIMPGMLGKELADKITTARPGTKVVFMSGYAQPVLTTHGTLAADVHLLEKPFTSVELKAALQQQLHSNISEPTPPLPFC